jgi:hypothetical protein
VRGDLAQPGPEPVALAAHPETGVEPAQVGRGLGGGDREIPRSLRTAVKALPYTAGRRCEVQRAGLGRDVGEVWPAAAAATASTPTSSFSRSVGAPQHAGQLLAPGTHREPLGVPDRGEAMAAQVDVSLYYASEHVFDERVLWPLHPNRPPPHPQVPMSQSRQEPSFAYRRSLPPTIRSRRTTSIGCAMTPLNATASTSPQSSSSRSWTSPGAGTARAATSTTPSSSFSHAGSGHCMSPSWTDSRGGAWGTSA